MRAGSANGSRNRTTKDAARQPPLGAPPGRTCIRLGTAEQVVAHLDLPHIAPCIAASEFDDGRPGPTGARHVVIFDRWSDDAMTNYVGHEQSGDSDTTTGFPTRALAGARWARTTPTRICLTLQQRRAHDPSCAYDDRWACPLAPSENWLDNPIRAGELTYPGAG